jgi:hypothetical protein
LALTVFALAIPEVTLAIPRVALAIPKVALAIPQVALAIPEVALAIPRVALAIPEVALAIPRVALAIPIVFPPRTAEFRTLLMPFIAPPPRLFLVRVALVPVEAFPRAIAFLSKIIVAPKVAFFAFAAKIPPLVFIFTGMAALDEALSRPPVVPFCCSGTAVAAKGPVTPPMRRSVVFVVTAGHEGSFSNRRDH